MIVSSSIHDHVNFLNSFLNTRIIFHCVSVPPFHYPFINWQATLLFLFSKYFEQNITVHGQASIPVEIRRVLWVFTKEWGSCIYAWSRFNFWVSSNTICNGACACFHPHQQWTNFYFIFYDPHQHLLSLFS